MCLACVEREGGWVPATSEMWTLAGLIWDWYRLPGNDVGGPLHVLLDDNNVEDSIIESCHRALTGDNHYSNEHRTIERDALGVMILDCMIRLSEAQRLTVTQIADPYGDRRPNGPDDSELIEHLRDSERRHGFAPLTSPLHTARLFEAYPPVVSDEPADPPHPSG